MPAAHTIQFPIHEYDCDPYAHLATANYLRFLHEADSAAMTALGAGRELLSGLGLVWMPRSTYIEFLGPLTPGDQLEITTRPLGLHRTRSWRGYEFRALSSDSPAANARVEWFLADSTTGGATLGPTEGLDLSPLGKGPPGDEMAAPQAPVLPPRPTGAFSRARAVQWSEVDPSFQLALEACARYLIDCSVQVGDSFGWSIRQAQTEGIAYLARKLWIDHRTPAFLGDELQLSTWISKPRRVTITRHYLLERVADHASVAQAHVLWMCVDIRNGKLVQHPQGWQDALRSQISDSDPDPGRA